MTDSTSAGRSTRRDFVAGSVAVALATATGQAPASTTRTTNSTYPKGFLWGAASAGHQVEGNNVNSDSWLLEHVRPTLFVEPSGDACDSYHRYADDIRLLQELGLNCYRFSLEWARIEPAEGDFSLAELDHYRRMLAQCREQNLVPVLTYNHFTVPAWFSARGGWEEHANTDYFVR